MITTWSYNSYGLCIGKTNAASGILFTNTYDAAGQLLTKYTPAKGTNIYSYDLNGNLTNINYPASADVSFKYDSANRLTNMVDAAGSTAFSLNQNGLVVTEDGPWASDLVTSVYLDPYRRSQVQVKSPSASDWIQSFIYGPSGRLQTNTSPAGSFVYRYLGDDLGIPEESYLVREIAYPSGADVFKSYDSLARLTNTTIKSTAGASLNSHAYSYASNNLVTLQTRFDASYVNYTNDTRQRLTSAVAKNADASERLHEKFGYNYDDNGNLLTRTNNLLLQNFGTNNLNQVTTATRSGPFTAGGGYQASNTVAITVNGVSATIQTNGTFAKTNITLSAGTNTFTAVASDAARSATHIVVANFPSTVTYAYDNNGNLTSDGQRGYAYDDENQLTSVTLTNVIKSEFTYDGWRRLRLKQDYQWAASAWQQTNQIQYVYDGSLVIQERCFDPRVSTVQPVKLISYTRGVDLSGGLQGAGGIGGLLARTEQTGTSTHLYYHSDLGGNITALVNTNDVVVGRYQYDPYGNVSMMSGEAAESNTYRFSSKAYDSNFDLYYYGYRFYVPALQRWLNRDPIGESGGLNLYGFVDNNPLIFIDGYGLVRWGDLCKGVVGAVVSGLGAGVGYAASATGVGALVGAPLAVYSSYQFGASLGNIGNALSDNDAGPSGPVEAAVTVATDNQQAQQLAAVADLGIPLLLSLGTSPQYARLPGIPLGPPGTIANTITRCPGDPEKIYPFLRAFQYGDAALAVGEAGESLFPYFGPGSSSPNNAPPSVVVGPR